MNIPKAIEILQYADTNSIVLGIPNLKDAIKLGIEALQHLQQRRIIHPAGNLAPLPGETKD